jgi:hypothetical protein
LRAVTEVPDGCSALSQGQLTNSEANPCLSWAHWHTLSPFVFLKGGGEVKVLLKDITASCSASCTLAFYLHTPILTFHLPTNPQHHLLHFCTIVLVPLGPQRGQERVKQGLFLEVLLSFSVTFILCCSRVFPQRLSEFPISLRLCWLQHWILFTSAVRCSGIFRMGWIPCNRVIVSQHPSVTRNAFVLNCWLVCKVIKMFWTEKEEYLYIYIYLCSEYDVQGKRNSIEK